MQKKIHYKTAIIKALNLILLLVTLNFYGQEKEIIKEIKQELFTNPTSAKKKSHKLLRLIKDKNLLQVESNAYYFLAELSGTLSEKDSCLYYYDKAIQKANESNNTDLILMYKINKANYLFNEFDFETSLKLYDESLNLANQLQNESSINYLTLKKASIYMETNRNQEALSIFRKCLKNNSFDQTTKLGVYLNLSKVHLKLESTDSSHYYLNEGYRKIKGNKEFMIHYLNQEGLILLDNFKFNKSEVVFNKAIILAEEISYIEMKRLLLINLAKVNTLKNSPLKSLQILSEILKNDDKVAVASENLYEIYYLMAQNYKAIDSFSLSNESYELFIQESNTLGAKKIKNINLLQKIDLKEIKSQKTTLIYQKWFLTVVVVLLIVVIFIYFLKKRNEDLKNDKKFKALIEKINNRESSLKNIPQPQTLNINSLENERNITTEIENDNLEIETSINRNHHIINDEKVKEILNNLIKLEEKKYFLNTNYSLNYVARKLKTNTAYLSKIINNELGISFSTYVNELRINYIILELKNNKKLRSYSIKAISEEIGYKSPESFNKYFKAKTGITPSLFIKKINTE